MIKSVFAKVEKWADKNGIIFDSHKFEAIYFSQKEVFSNLDIKLLPFLLLRYNIPNKLFE